MPKKRIDDETRKQIVDMYAHGKVHREIHEITGVSMGTISKICCDAGLDRYHVGGRISKTIAMPNEDTTKEINRNTSAKENMQIDIIERILTMHGNNTGCTYVAGTNMPNIDITLGDWAISIERGKLNSFIEELSNIKKIIGIM